jgi:UDP-3-O-[3-hydroxymyristoyl] glucosamine N-acyltransferase
MNRSLKEVAEFVQGRVVGDGGVSIRGISSISAASPGDLVFVEDEKILILAMNSPASAVIAGESAATKTLAKPLLICSQPRLAFAKSARLFTWEEVQLAGMHSSAIVHSSARLGKDVFIAERVVVGENVVIGDGTRIGAGSVVGASVSLGRNCHLYPNVTIYPGVRLGDRVIVHAGTVLGSDGFGYVRDQSGRYEKFPQIGRLEVEDDVEIGANSTIDRGALEVTRIGRGTKIDNLVHIGHNCQIGEDVVIAAQTGVSGSAVVENNVVIGGQVGIADHVRIEEGVLLGAQCGVPSNKIVRGKGVAFWGTPARPLREYLKQLAVLARLTRKEYWRLSWWVGIRAT